MACRKAVGPGSLCREWGQYQGALHPMCTLPRTVSFTIKNESFPSPLFITPTILGILYVFFNINWLHSVLCICYWIFFALKFLLSYICSKVWIFSVQLHEFHLCMQPLYFWNFSPRGNSMLISTTTDKNRILVGGLLHLAFSLIIMSVRVTHGVCGSSLFLFIAAYYSIVWIDLNLFVQPV